MLEFETRGRYSNSESSLETRIGNVFYGTEGYLELNGDTWKAFKKKEKVPFAGSKPTSGPGKVESLTGEEGAEHFANFIDAIRSGKDADLNCSITEGHYSAALPHLANISHRLGRGLNFNGSAEKFFKDSEADAMLSRKVYRKPYIVPDKV